MQSPSKHLAAETLESELKVHQLMWRLFSTSLRAYFALIWQTIRPGRERLAPLGLKRAVVMCLFLPVFGLAQAVHWLGFLLDELFFSGYRRVEVRQPVFVLGVPRSGTTFLHRVLALDDRYTTFSTWECLLAPSITERRVIRGLIRLDQLLGRPFGRLFTWLERRAFGGMDGVHEIALAEPEEDFFAFLPILRCFLLVVPFPDSERLWEMGFFDREVPEEERRRVMAFYKACLQKHLYVHGAHRTLLSKNASFAPLVASLVETFPDCRILSCERDLVEIVPSQLSSVRQGLEIFGVDPYDLRFRDRIIERLLYYRSHLRQVLEPLPSHRRAFLPMAAFKGQLAVTVRQVYEQLEIPLHEDFAARLKAEGQKARTYRSSHRYTLEEYGLDRASLEEKLREPAAAATELAEMSTS